MAGGRPRVHNREQIALDLIEWAKKPDSINLCGFCCSCEPPLDPAKLSQWAAECDEFRKAHRIAKMFLGHRREIMLSQDLLHVKAYDLNATTYDPFLKEEKIANMKLASELAKDTEKAKQGITINLTDYSKDKS